MPKIQWTGLPLALRDHLFEPLRERKIAADDLYQLKLWCESPPDAPEGAWHRDFGSFKVCGEGQYPNVSAPRAGRGRASSRLARPPTPTGRGQ